jgi:hypothetical protein
MVVGMEKTMAGELVGAEVMVQGGTGQPIPSTGEGTGINFSTLSYELFSFLSRVSLDLLLAHGTFSIKISL